MAYVDFLSVVHKSTTRDYVARVVEFPKAEAAKLAKKWDVEYWDGAVSYTHLTLPTIYSV